MADALVRADLDLAADVCGDLAAQVTLHLVVAFDVVAEGDQLVVGEVLDADRLVDLGGLQDLDRTGTADAVDVGEGDHHALISIAKELNWTHERILRHYVRETGLDEETIKEKLIGKGDFFFSPEEALKLNLADQIKGL